MIYIIYININYMWAWFDFMSILSQDWLKSRTFENYVVVKNIWNVQFVRVENLNQGSSYVFYIVINKSKNDKNTVFLSDSLKLYCYKFKFWRN